VGNTLVGIYAKCGSIGSASTVFDMIPQRDVVSWNELIARYDIHGFCEESLQIFEKMQSCGMNPSHVTFTGVLIA